MMCCRDLYSSVKEDTSDVQEVFPDPSMALEMFMQRLLEQNVQAALERLLLPSGLGMQALAAATAAATAAAEGNRLGSPGPPLLTSYGSFRERATSFAASFSSPAAPGPSAMAGDTAGAAAVSAWSNVSHAATSALLQQQQLRLLDQSYVKTQKLAGKLEKIARAVAPLDVSNMAEGLWPAFLTNYPAQELNWLQAAYQEEVCCGQLQHVPSLT